MLDAIIAKLRAAGCVFAEDEARLLTAAAGSPAQLDAMVARRAGGEPLEYVVGWAEFCGLRISVEPGVFVPRRRTEFLVQHTINRYAGQRPRLIVDLCCGSGAIGIALATALGMPELHASDVDEVAVRCARRNIAPIGGRAYLGDLFEPLPAALRGQVDILAANVPYVPSGEVELLPAEARLHEPRSALDGGPDGLDVLRRVAAAAPRWLAPGGLLVTETSERQIRAALAVLREAGLAAEAASSEESGATVVTAFQRFTGAPSGAGDA